MQYLGLENVKNIILVNNTFSRYLDDLTIETNT